LEKLHNEELRNFYYLPNVIRMIKTRVRWAGNVERVGEKRNAYRVLMGKPVGRPGRRWEDNIKIDLRADSDGAPQEVARWREYYESIFQK
jgi:hypothetical protein